MGLRRSRGFTLPELMIVITIMGVLISAGVPAFAGFIRNQRVKTASFDLFSTLMMARSEAITRNTPVTVRPVTTANWANGWTVTYVDAASGSTVTLRDEAAVPSVTVTGPTSVVYRGSGRLTGTADPQFQLTSSGTSIVTRCLNVDLSGRPVSKAAAC
jgi:type IV fimbrial biogenesis protein FimT